ncbi:hypothetical protein EAG_07542 [Camponotus floridanus]|uniref:Uncharacterized protein n=1 Tax=Camponotus floridanus TaxID=104421 RepID=E2A425_CAMFO|nr:hypothetical protein EAG_07542 [Camponotus floridanus]
MDMQAYDLDRSARVGPVSTRDRCSCGSLTPQCLQLAKSFAEWRFTISTELADIGGGGGSDDGIGVGGRLVLEALDLSAGLLWGMLTCPREMLFSVLDSPLASSSGPCVIRILVDDPYESFWKTRVFPSATGVTSQQYRRMLGTKVQSLRAPTTTGSSFSCKLSRPRQQNSRLRDGTEILVDKFAPRIHRYSDGAIVPIRSGFISIKF